MQKIIFYDTQSDFRVFEIDGVKYSTNIKGCGIYVHPSWATLVRPSKLNLSGLSNEEAEQKIINQLKLRKKRLKKKERAKKKITRKDGWDFVSKSKIIKTRTEHDCSGFCQREMPRGSKMEIVSGILENEKGFTTTYKCIECLKLESVFYRPVEFGFTDDEEFLQWVLSSATVSQIIEDTDMLLAFKTCLQRHLQIRLESLKNRGGDGTDYEDIYEIRKNEWLAQDFERSLQLLQSVTMEGDYEYE